MKISVIIPMYNEKGNAPIILKKLVESIREWPDEYEIIAVDDFSTDVTADILKDYSIKYDAITAVIRRGGKRGMGMALICGMKESGGDIIVWVMGDLSDNLEKIPEMVDKIKKGYNIVFGSRYMEGGSIGNLGRLKAFLSSRFTVFARILFGIGVDDITNAFRAFRREVGEKVKLESPDFAISPELAIKAHLLGYKLGEVPCSYASRVADKTKFKMFRMVTRYFTLFKYRFYRRKDIAK